MKIGILLAAYNEEKNIGPIINGIKKVLKKFKYKIIVVDDGSIDKTSSVAKKLGAFVIQYKKNRGVGYATSIGLKKTMEMKPDIIIIIDADRQHDPRYIPQFINEIKKGSDYVYGKRNLSNYSINRKIGNWSLTILTNLVCPTKIRDIECGFRAFTYGVARKLNLKANGYEREVDFIYEIWKNKFKISYVEIKVPKFYPKPAILRGLKNFKYLLKRRFGI